jgi:hypothetical protein
MANQGDAQTGAGKAKRNGGSEAEPERERGPENHGVTEGVSGSRGQAQEARARERTPGGADKPPGGSEAEPRREGRAAPSYDPDVAGLQGAPRRTGTPEFMPSDAELRALPTETLLGLLAERGIEVTPKQRTGRFTGKYIVKNKLHCKPKGSDDARYVDPGEVVELEPEDVKRFKKNGAIEEELVPEEPEKPRRA